MAEAKKTTRKSTKKVTEAEPEVKQEAVAEAATDIPAEKPAERMYTEAEVQAMIASLLAKQKKPEEEIVRLYYAGVCAAQNEAELPGYGVIRPGQYMEIPKKEFSGKFMTPQARKFIAKRRILVLDGLTEAECRRWNCDYKRGEVLTENALDNLLDMPMNELETLFSLLCKEHKQFVARYINSIVDSAKRNEKALDNRITMPLLRALNEAALGDFPDGLFKQTIEAVRAEL